MTILWLFARLPFAEREELNTEQKMKNIKNNRKRFQIPICQKKKMCLPLECVCVFFFGYGFSFGCHLSNIICSWPTSQVNSSCLISIFQHIFKSKKDTTQQNNIFLLFNVKRVFFSLFLFFPFSFIILLVD